jgi:hypothetical protein
MGFIEDDQGVRGLKDFPRERVHVELLVAHRQAPHVGIVFAVVGHALLQELLCPWPKGQSLLEALADVAKRRHRFLVEAERLTRCARRPPGDAEDTGEVGLSVGRPERRCVEVYRSIRQSGRARGLAVRPLRGEGDGERDESTGGEQRAKRYLHKSYIMD